MDEHLALGMRTPDALALFRKFENSNKVRAAPKAAAGSEHGHEITDLRYAGNRISAAGLQPLPRRGGGREPRRRFRRARRHLTYASIDRAGTEMDRRSRRRQALWARRADPGKYFDRRREGRHLENPGGADFQQTSRLH